MLTHDQLDALLVAHVPEDGARSAVVDLVMGIMGRELVLAAYDLGQHSVLTKTERLCLSMAFEGKPRKVIAADTGVSVGAVDQTMGRAYRKLRVQSLPEAMAACHVSPT